MHEVCKDLASVKKLRKQQTISSGAANSLGGVDCNTITAAAAAGVDASHTCAIRQLIGGPSEAPQWFLDAELRLRNDQYEWRNELRKRMDKQEAMQAEQTAAQRQTNELLKTLISDCNKLIRCVAPIFLDETGE